MVMVISVLFMISCNNKDDDYNYPLTVTDVDGNIYNTIIIGTQLWTTENLKTTKYNTGIAIPLVTDSLSWADLTTPGYCWYNNDENNKDTYGALYNCYAVNTRKLCPIGWHVPADKEWTTLTDYLGGQYVAGVKLKEAGNKHWITIGGTNETGFTALPGGNRVYYSGSFKDIGMEGIWWSSSDYLSSFAWCRFIFYNLDEIFRVDNYKKWGFSVRCIRD
jgi:uncharacterized protein (TIGR02145 family)